MKWVELTDREEIKLWKSINKKLGVDYKYREFHITNPTIRYQKYKMILPQNFEAIDNFIEEYESIIKRLFLQLTAPDENIYALKLNSSCYQLNMYSSNTYEGEEEWVVPVYLDGEFYIFISSEMDWGIVIHPEEQFFAFFGSRLIEQLEPLGLVPTYLQLINEEIK
ncbi:DUF2716 domain-containing protein [Niallia sp. 03190]|uniref:DUF2716 domain-containing protein n=1 Tax=Niallia sp. 03190 TaxID=3458061 RepID=UPI004044A023